MEHRDEPAPEIAELVADLHAFETLLAETLAAGGRLAGSAVRAQSSRRLSVTACAAVYASFIQSSASVSSAMEHVADGHRRLEALGRRMGVDVRGYGESQKPPTQDDGGLFTGADGSDSAVAA